MHFHVLHNSDQTGERRILSLKYAVCFIFTNYFSCNKQVHRLYPCLVFLSTNIFRHLFIGFVNGESVVDWWPDFKMYLLI